MTEEMTEDVEHSVLSSAKMWGPHAVSFRGPSDGRFAACSCQGWRLLVAKHSASDVLAAYSEHLETVQRANAPETVAGRRAASTSAAPRSTSASWSGLGSVPPARMANSVVTRARATVNQLFWCGLGLAIVGTLIAFVASLHAPGLSLVCFVAAGIGEAMILIALLAWGVRLGIESSERASS